MNAEGHQIKHGIVLVDGVCHLCQGVTKFVIKRDAAGYFRFASLQSKIGQTLLSKYNLGLEVETVVLIEEGKAYVASDAVLRISRHLSLPWKLFYVLKWVPHKLRNGLYKVVARNRYRWFGRDEVCLLPSPELRSRFLEEEGE